MRADCLYFETKDLDEVSWLSKHGIHSVSANRDLRHRKVYKYQKSQMLYLVLADCYAQKKLQAEWAAYDPTPDAVIEW